MLMRNAAKEARLRLSHAIERYNTLQGHVQGASVSLYELRKQSAEVLVARVQTLVNQVADHPKTFDQSFAEFRIELKKFAEAEKSTARRFEAATTRSAGGAVLGASSGAATALAGPTAAMAVATTFGTASTGTAISTLSGAAATKAGLAWLGGGALTTGAGGMVAGKALLALAGPIGWGLAGTAIVGGAGYSLYANYRVTKEFNAQCIKVLRAHADCEQAMSSVGHLLDVTCTHAAGLRGLLAHLEEHLPASYKDFSDEQIQAIGALVNHVRSLSVLLNQTLETLAQHTGQQSTHGAQLATTQDWNRVLAQGTAAEKAELLQTLRSPNSANWKLTPKRATNARPTASQGA